MRYRDSKERIGRQRLQNATPQKSSEHSSIRQRPGESGQTTVVMAIFMATFLFGFVAFGIDVEALFHAKRTAQSAADAAAIAAAEESSNGNTAEQSAANAIAKLNGIPTAVLLHTPPSTGNYTGTTTGSYIEAVVSQPVSTYFIGVINHKTTMTVSARAVAAAGQSSPTCVCLEGQTGTDLNLSNNAKLTASGCGTTVDSNSSAAVQIVGSATLSGISLGTVSSTWDNSSNINNAGTISSSTKVVLGISTQCSPPLPTIPTYTASSCTADPLTTQPGLGNGGSTYSLGPGATSPYTNTQGTNLACYNSLTIGANGDKVTLNPGIYVINGGTLHFESGANNASNIGGNGVFFYLVGNANLVIDNGANVNLTAPTSGTYANTLIYQDAADTQTMSIQGGSNTSFNGAIYAPSSNVTLGNGSGTAIDADLVANTLTMNGGGTLNSTATSNFGTLNISVAKLTE